MMRRISFVQAIFTTIVVLILGALLPLRVLAQDSNIEEVQVTTTHVETHPSQGEVREIEGSTATLMTTEIGATVNLATSQLEDEHIYTFWWVIVNNPDACETSPCTAGDIIGNSDAVQAEITWADGLIYSSEESQMTFSAFLPAGDVVEPWYGNGFTNPLGAEIHMVINDHGVIIPEMASTMLNTYRGGCADEGLPPFPESAIADGEPGPNTCRLVQAVSFMQFGVVAQDSDMEGSTGQVEVVKAFEESPNHLPEGVTLDKQGNIFASLGPPFFVGGGYGAVTQISPDGAETLLVEYPEGPAVAGLTVDARGNVYFAMPNPGQPETGVYRVTDDGAERFPGTENMLVPNGLAFDQQGNLYASDSILGSIWRIPRDGDEMLAAESWLSHDLLAGCDEENPVGANGIALWEDGFYVANTSKGILVYVSIQEDGAPGTPELIAGNPECSVTDELFGLDGIALDVDGNVYALLVLQHKLVRIDPEDGTATLLLSEEDGLWNPASLAFGSGQDDQQSLYIANYAVLPPEPTNSLGPAVLKFNTGVPGLPLP